MRTRTIGWLVFVAATAACASTNKPRTYGAYNDLSPVVAPQKGERTPQHLTIQLARPSNVAVIYVIPGRPSQLLFPADSTSSGFMDAGSHLVETAFARRAPSDTSRLLRRPGDIPAQVGGRGNQGRRGVPGARGDSASFFGLGRGYLLVYASQQPLPYAILNTRVNGISVPIDDADALNTVTKLIRETTHTDGTWAAYATEYPP